MLRRLGIIITLLLGCLVLAAPAFAWDGAIGGGGAFATGSAPPAQKGGATGGSFRWWDIRNMGTQTLTWPRSITLQSDMALWAGTDTGVYRTAAQSAVTYDVAPLNNKIFWTNICATSGANKLTPANGTSPTDCTRTSSYDSVIGSQVHTATASGGMGGEGQIVAWNVKIWRSQTIDFTKTYPENGATVPTQLIWSRQVGINGVSDGVGIDPSTWWLGEPSGGTTASSNATFAGPIGAFGSKNPQAPCITRYQAAQELVTAVRKGNGYKQDTTYQNASSLDSGTKLGQNDCYWDITKVANPQNDESLWVSATFSAQGRAELTYKFAGHGNTVYCMQITAVDDREQLIDPGFATAVDTEAGLLVQDHNYFRCFVPKVSACTIDGTTYYHPGALPPGYTWKQQDNGIFSCPTAVLTCTISGTVFQYPDPLPSGYAWVSEGVGKWSCPANPKQQTFPHAPPTAPVVHLTADSPVPARVWALSTVQVLLPDGIPPDQAVIPDQVTLTHFSPQTAYDGYHGFDSAYPETYVRYDSDLGAASRVLAPFPGPPPPGQISGSGPVYQARLIQPAQLSSGGGGDLLLAENQFRISWLQPTFTNPCSFDKRLSIIADPSTGAWPTWPNVCGVYGSDALPRDAWDDTLTASTLYEQRWVNGPSSNDNQGWVDSQWLRCNDGTNLNTQFDVSSGCKNRITFVDYSGPAYLANVANSTRHAQGYVYLGGDAKGGQGAAAFILTTNLTGNISARQVWNRATGAQIDTSVTRRTQPANYVNTVTGQPSMFFDEPGLPAGAKLALGSGNAVGDRAVAANEQGDQQIAAGYTLAWNWSTWSSNYSVQDACSTSAGAPASSNFHSPSLDAPVGTNGIASGVAAALRGQYGDYTSYGTDPLFAGNPTWWAATLHEPDAAAGGKVVNTVPYDGTRPGNGNGEAEQPCSKVASVSDHAASYASGYWYIDHIVNEQVITGYQTKKTLTGYGTKQVISGYKTKQVCTTKTVKGKKVTTCETEPDYTKPIYKTEPDYTKPIYKTEPDYTKPIYKTVVHHVYDFQVSGDIYTTNAAAHKATITPSKPGGIPENDNAHAQLQQCWNGQTACVRNTLTLQQVLNDTTNWLNWGSPWVPANLAPDWNVQGWASFSTPGFVQTGQWGVGRGAGPGWGVNQTGYRLPGDSGYMVDYTFSNLDGNALANGFYTLQGRYDGYPGWDWKTKESQTTANADSTATVSVFATRDSR